MRRSEKGRRGERDEVRKGELEKEWGLRRESWREEGMRKGKLEKERE